MDLQFVTLLFLGLGGVTLLLSVVTGSATLFYLSIPLIIIGLIARMKERKSIQKK